MKKRRPFNVTKLIFASGIIFFALLVNAKNAVLITEKKAEREQQAKEDELSREETYRNSLIQSDEIVRIVTYRGLGDSKFDKNICSQLQLEDLNEFRAASQPTIDKWGNGIGKFAVTSLATTVSAIGGMAWV